VHEALGLSETVFRALIVVVAIVVSGVVVWFWVSWPEPADDVAHPVQQVGASPSTKGLALGL
jgi:hypothetical protein